MKLVVEYEFNTQNQWPAYFSAPVYYKDGYMYYPYGTTPTLFCRKIAIDGSVQESSFIVSNEKKVALPSHWKLFEYKGHVILSCGNQYPPTKAFPDRVVCSIFLDLDDEMREIHLPVEIEQKQLCLGPFHETADVVLSDCTMKYKNSRSYQCFDYNDNLIWTEQHKGYRYTNFEEVDNCIIFGTAGHGGGVYCYKKTDGQCLCAIDTKGTTAYVWCNNSLVGRGRNGELLFINPFKGEIEKSVTLKGLLSDESSYYVDDKFLCVVGFEKKTNSPCVYLFDVTID